MNKETQTAENLYYRNIDPSDAAPARRDQNHGLPSVEIQPLRHDPTSSDAPAPLPDPPSAKGQPPYLFATSAQLLDICRDQNLTIAQVIWENELAFRPASAIRKGLLNCGSDLSTLTEALY